MKHESDECMEELRRTRDYLDAIVSVSYDGIAVFNEQQLVEYVNDAACRFMGMDREQLIGQHLSAFAPPELQEFYQQKWERMMTAGVEPYEGEILKPDGSRVPVLLSDKVVNVGGQKKCVTIVKDISELKAIQKALQNSNVSLEKQVDERTTELSRTVAERDRVIGALRESEGKYREVVENCGFIVVTYGCDGRIRYVNGMGEKLLGQKASDMVGRHVAEVAGPQVGGRVAERIRHLVETGEAYDDVDEVVTPTGPRWMWGHPSVARDVGGKPESVTVFLSDVTEKKLAEIKLARSDANHRMLVNYAGFVVIRCDLDGTIRFINDMGCQYVDRKPEEVIGRNIVEVWWQPSGEVFMGGIRGRALEKGKDIERELYMAWQDPRWFWARYNIMRDSGGKPESVVFFAHDITVQKHGEMKLKESEANFRTFFESMTDMIMVGTRAGRILFTNAAVTRTLGYSAEELANMRLLDVHRAEDRPEAEEILAAILRGDRESCPLPLARKDGGLVPVETRVWLGRWNGQDCVFGISKDLTAEQEAQDRFEQLFRNNPALIALSALPEMRFADVNDAFLKILGYSRSEVVGKAAVELGLFVNPEQQAAAANKMLAEGHIANIELQVRHKNGTILDGLFSGEIISSQGRQYFLTVMVDITERKLAQAKLEESQERQRVMAEAVFEGIFIHDDGVLIEANKWFYDMVGYTAQELVGKQILPLVLTQEAQKIIEQNMHDSHSHSVRVTGVRKDGTLFPVEVTGRDIVHSGRKVRVAIAIDLSERIKAQQKLWESEERYRDVIENSGLVVACFDMQAKFTLINSLGASRLMKKEEDIIGKMPTEVVLLPVTEMMESHIREVAASGRSMEIDEEVVLPVGRRWVQMRLNPTLDACGAVTGVILFSQDITERRLAQVALKESENRRRMLTEMSMEGIFMHADGILMEANPRYFEMFGYTPEELIGKQARDITLTPESLQRQIENMRTGVDKRIQVMGVRKDGSQFPCEIYGLNAAYKGQNVRVAVVMDISERVKAEAELSELRERMSITERLAAVGYVGASMAHEINTPLSVMRLTAQMLISDLEKNKERKGNTEQAKTILHEIDRASGIVRRFREMSRPPRDVDNKTSEIQAVPERVIQLIKKTADQKKLELVVGPEIPELLVRLGIADSAEQLLFILIENAIQAADGKKWRKLKISGCVKDGIVELLFADNCGGISQENLRKIFEPFFSTKPRNVGTGLGLSIVRRLLQERGGQIKVESKVGKGTTFIVTYPA